MSNELARNIKKVFIATFVMGLIAYGYLFVNYIPSHDGMMIVKTNQWWEMSVGRFVVLYYAPIRGLYEAPWMIGLLSTTYVAISAFLTIQILDIGFDTWKVYVVSALYVFNIAFISNAGVYLFCFDVLTLALLFAVLAVYLSTRFQNIISGLAAILLLAFSLGMYQSYIAVAVGLYMLVACKRLVNGDETKKVFRNGITSIVILILSGVAYYILVRVFQALSGVEPYTGAYESIESVFSLGFSDFVHGMIIAYKQVLRFLFKDSLYASIMPLIINSLIVIIGMVSWILVLIRFRMPVISKILLGALILIFPIGVNCFSIFLGGVVYQLMFFPYQLVLLLLLFPVLIKNNESISVKPQMYMRIATVVAVSILSFCVVRYANDLFYYQKLVGAGTDAQMTGILYDIERTEGFDDFSTPVILLGDASQALGAPYEQRDIYSNTAGLSPSGTTITYNECFKWYMRYVFGRDFQYETDQATVDSLIEREAVTDMPCYPEAGYVQMVDDHLVIKLQNE